MYLTEIAIVGIHDPVPGDGRGVMQRPQHCSDHQGSCTYINTYIRVFICKSLEYVYQFIHRFSKNFMCGIELEMLCTFNECIYLC